MYATRARVSKCRLEPVLLNVAGTEARPTDFFIFGKRRRLMSECRNLNRVALKKAIKGSRRF